MDQPLTLLNTSEVALWLGISTRTVCLWAECSVLPAIKLGRQWRFRRETILQWIADDHPVIFQKKLAAAPAIAAYTLFNPPV
jgi:excisionase family DNA binding protein